MDATFHALGELLLNALPTFVLVFLLFFYLKYVFFRPLSRMLEARYEATEGARKRAGEVVERAAAKTGEYEAAMRSARAEVYATQEELHRMLEEQRAVDLEAAHKRVQSLVKQAQEQIEGDLAESREKLLQDSDVLANQITDTILSRGVA